MRKGVHGSPWALTMGTPNGGVSPACPRFGWRRPAPVARAAPGGPARAWPPPVKLVDLPVDHPLHDGRLADELEAPSASSSPCRSISRRPTAMTRSHQLLGDADLGDALQADLRRCSSRWDTSRRTTTRVVVKHNRVRPPAQLGDRGTRSRGIAASSKRMSVAQLGVRTLATRIATTPATTATAAKSGPAKKTQCGRISTRRSSSSLRNFLGNAIYRRVVAAPTPMMALKRMARAETEGRQAPLT